MFRLGASAVESEHSSNLLNVSEKYEVNLGVKFAAIIIKLKLSNETIFRQYVDPSLSIVIVIIIVASTIPLLKESSLVLMQTVPNNFRVEELRENLLRAVPQIQDIHEVIHLLFQHPVLFQMHTGYFFPKFIEGLGPLCRR